MASHVDQEKEVGGNTSEAIKNEEASTTIEGVEDSQSAENDPNSTGSDDVPSFKVPTLQEIAPSLASKAEKHKLVKRYAQLFRNHFNRPKFVDSLQKTNYATYVILHNAEENKYSDIDALHTEFDLLTATHLRHVPKHLQKVGIELNTLAQAAYYWWPKCVNMSPQDARMDLLENVFARMEQDGFEVTALLNDYEEFFSQDYNEGVMEIYQEYMMIGSRPGLGRG